MIRQDPISKGLTIIGLLIPVFISTFELTLYTLFPSFLLIAGIVGQRYVLKKIEEDPTIDVGEFSDIMFWTFTALAVIFASSLVIPYFNFPSSIETETLDIMSLRLFVVLMAIAEEQFFRGFLTNFFLVKLPPAFAVLASGSIFAIYHFGVYGTSFDLIGYVWIAGTILSYIAVKTQRLSPCMLAHIVNNLLAV